MEDRSKEAVAVFDKLAERYQQKYMDTSLYHDTFDMFCCLITSQNARLLDVACGPGNITQYLLSEHPSFRILGIDLAPNMLQLAKANNPAADFRMMDGRDIHTLAETFDGIMCGFFLPYLSKEDVAGFLAGAAQKLYPGGVLYISTMEGDYKTSGRQTSSPGDAMFIHYHEEAYLAEALTSAGLIINKVIRKEYYMGDVLVTDMIIIATKRL